MTITEGTSTGHLPTSLEGITPQWLTTALSERHPGTVVEDVRVESVIWGTATKVFLDVDYAHRPASGPPRALCVKGGFQDEMRGIVGIGYQIEANFYRDIAPALESGLPRTWYAGASPEQNQGLVITDDLREQHASFGSPVDAFPVDRVAEGLELLATWHGLTWNRSGVAKAPWLTVGSELYRPYVQTYFREEYWEPFMQQRPTVGFSDDLRDMRRVERAVHGLWQLDDQDVLSVSHGDPHMGNTYWLPHGPLRFLDWQTVNLSPWSDDVAYFMVGALSVEDRRASDADLLRHYLEVLQATAGAAPGFDEAWLAFRRHHLHGLLFALCPPEMQPPEIVIAMGDRYAAAAVEHESLAALEEAR